MKNWLLITVAVSGFVGHVLGSEKKDMVRLLQLCMFCTKNFMLQ